MAIRPPFFAFIDKQATNVDAQFDLSPLALVGVQIGQVIESILINTLGLIGATWDTYLDYGTLRSPDYLDESTAQRWSATKLEYAIGGSVVSAPGAGVTELGTYFFEGNRVQLEECLLAPGRADPLLIPEAIKPGRLWVYLRTEDIAFPQSPTALIRVESVGPAVIENPQAGELALVGVDIDLNGVTTGNTYPAVEPAEEVVFGSRVQRWTGSTTFDGRATFNSPGTIAIVVAGQLSIDGDAITGLNVVNDDAGNPSARFENATGLTALFVSVGDTAVLGQTTAGSGVKGESLGSGLGVSGVGGPSSVSRGGSFQAGHVDAFALLGTSFAGSSNLAVAVQGTGTADAIGVKGFGSDGYGVVAQSDLTTPTRAAMRYVPQDDDPSTALAGDAMHNSSRGTGGIRRLFTTQWKSLHCSPKGYVEQPGVAVSGSLLAGANIDLSLVQVQAEEVGIVVVEVTGHLDWSADAASTIVQLRDVTLGLTINGGGFGVTEYPIVGAVGRDHSFVARFPYTLPDTTLRTFAVKLSAAGGTTTYTDVVVTVKGTF